MELGAENQAREKDAVTGTRQALGVLGKLALQAVQQNQGGHQGTGVDVGVADQLGEKRHERRKRTLFSWKWLQGVTAGKHLEGGHHQLVNHILRHRSVDEDRKSLEIECTHGG